MPRTDNALDAQQARLRAANKKRNLLAEARALELQAKHPQVSMFSASPPDLLAPEQKAQIYGSGYNDAGLARVVGHGKRKAPKKEKEELVEEPSSDEDSGAEIEMVGSGLSGGAMHQGQMLGQHLMKMHGKGFFDDFAKGFMSVIKPIASVASFIPGPIGSIAKVVSSVAGNGKKMKGGNVSETAHAAMQHVPSMSVPSISGATVPKGALPPVAMGNAPQAPMTFKRNSMGMGAPAGGGTKKGMERKTARKAYEGMGSTGAGNLHIVHEGSGVSGGAISRGAVIKMIMCKMDYKLPEASKWLKEQTQNGSTLAEVAEHLSKK